MQFNKRIRSLLLIFWVIVIHVSAFAQENPQKGTLSIKKEQAPECPAEYTHYAQGGPLIAPFFPCTEFYDRKEFGCYRMSIIQYSNTFDKRVIYSTSKQRAWDGINMIDSTYAPPGTYVWKIDYQRKKGALFQHKAGLLYIESTPEEVSE